MDRIPPKMTAAVRAAIAMPNQSRIEASAWVSPNTVFFTTTISTIAFDWAMLPMPKAARAVKAAKRIPAQRAFRPRSKTNIGPPDISPRLFWMRYFTASRASEYLVAMPKTPVNHIQKTAPGPPISTAPATP